MGVSWQKDYEIGVEEIDRQHKVLFEKVNNLLDKYEADKTAEKKNKEQIEDLFFFLTDYFETHFSSEEELQEKIGFSEQKEHQERHKAFIERINEFKYDYLNLAEDEIDDELFLEISNQVLNWMINHIGGEDKKIAKFIKDKQ